ncbi:MAG: Smr/MutS family protein, partial [Muribaculaceae bacterium]|nr:Smr/MutS family protein [Muribaculaceae bacterium]
LAALTDDIRPHADEILSSNDALGHLDFVHAKACYARDVDGRLPVVEQRRELEWYHAVHPGLKASLARQGKEPVPLNITLTSRDRILVISGPNAGGKSVCLKTVGLIQYMIQCGVLPTVYENSHIGVFSNIFIDIGDDQSIDNDLSTYSSHLMNMKAFLRYGDRATLILIDEMGSGTEPQIGGAIAQATLQEFNNKKMWGVVTTHYQNLKNFAHDTAGLVNGSMLYDRQAMRPLFQLSIGNPGSSFAIEIARKTGMPSDILAVAEEIVGSEYVSIDRYLLDINRDKKYWENKRAEIKAKEKKLDSLLERYEADADELREKRNAILREAKEEAKGIIEKSNAAIERTIHEIRTAQAERERTLEARRRLAEEHRDIANPDTMPENEILKKAPKPKKKAAKKPTSPTVVAVGAFVRLDGKGTIGKVISIEGKKATVEFGALSTTVAIDRLTPTDDRPTVSAGQAASFVSATTRDNLRQRQLEFRDEIDVRGMRADEAIQAVTYFIDDALQFNVKKVRILHGTGTGALRQSIRQYLRTVAGVEKFHDEHVQFGGAGITVVEL